MNFTLSCSKFRGLCEGLKTFAKSELISFCKRRSCPISIPVLEDVWDTKRFKSEFLNHFFVCYTHSFFFLKRTVYKERLCQLIRIFSKIKNMTSANPQN